jgi:sugar phosphate isomerase/epimerase
MELTRKEFMQTIAGAAVSATVPIASGSATGSAPAEKMKFGCTMYSYGPDIRSGAMTLEDCIADVGDIGLEGIEILGEAHIPDYPNPSNKWVEQWFGWMEKYKVKPGGYDTFVDSMFYPNRMLTSDEAAERLVVDFKLANRLGIKALRQQWPPFPADSKADEIYAPYVKSKLAMETIMKALPSAEKYDVRMGIELHSPTQLKSAFIDSIVEVVDKTKTKHLGFCPDMTAFMKRAPRLEQGAEVPALSTLLKRGARQNILDFIEKAYEEKLGPEKTVAEVKKMGGNEVEIWYGGVAGIYHLSNNDPKDLAPLVPYVRHIHAKFYEITDQLREYSIPYEEILPILDKGGYTGYISSEYSGWRDAYTSSAALRAHHAMCRSILGITA